MARIGPAALASECQLRLGELAFEEERYAIAARWYERALDGSLAAPLRVTAIYKYAWSLYLAGREREAVLRRFPAEGRPDLREDLARLAREIGRRR